MKTLKRGASLLVVVALTFVLVGCYSHTHQVGTGAQGNEVSEVRQWFILYGLVPIKNAPDTTELAGSATNYTIKSEITVVDGLINILANIIPTTVSARTVTITK